MMDIKRDALPSDLARALSISVDSVGRYARAGLIPFNHTPKGHRRYNIDEVRQTLESLEQPNLSRLVARRPRPSSRIGAGREVVINPSAALRESLRGTVTRSAKGARAPEGSSATVASALDDMLRHARNVMVATSA